MLDRVIQQAIAQVLNPLYEGEFSDHSYGFREGRNAHQAVRHVEHGWLRRRYHAVDCDLKAFFDTVSHEWMQRFIEHRIADKRMVRLLMKWMKAGVMEEGVRHEVERGTPQGGLISPLMANIFLHYALDLWVVKWRRSARGEVYFVRYADDFVVGFEEEEDAQKMRVEIEERLKQFELTMHPEKTRVVPFGKKAASSENGPARAFDFLGFTHLATRDEKGSYMLRRRTAKKKRRAKIRGAERRNPPAKT